MNARSPTKEFIIEEHVDPCGTVGTNSPPWHVRGVAITQLLVLRIDLGRPFVGKTGPTGFFDFDLNWSPRWACDLSFDRSRFPDIDLAGPDIFLHRCAAATRVQARWAASNANFVLVATTAQRAAARSAARDTARTS